jgi:hypothetical protein
MNISFPAAPVTSVAGRTGAVVLSSSDITGLGTAAVLNVGTAAGNVVQLDGSGKVPGSTLPNALVTSVSASAPLSSSGGNTPNISLSQASGSSAGYLSSADWSSFNSKQNALGFAPLNPANNLSDLSSSATGRTNLGLGSASVLNAGTSPNNLVQLDAGSKIPVSTLPNSVILSTTALTGDVSGTTGANSVVTVGGKTSSQIATSVNDTSAATSANTSSTLVKRDAAGGFVVTSVSATSVGAANVYLTSGAKSVQLKAAAGLSSDLTLTMPTNNGSAGQVLQTDGAGNLTWGDVSSAGGSVSSVTASAPLSSSGGSSPNITITQATTTTSGYLSSGDWNTFNGKQNALGFTPLNKASNLSDLASVSTARTNLGLGGAALLSVGTTTGTVAAGDDSRITGALQTSAYSSDVAPAALCTTAQTPYWNTVSDTWACQAIAFPVTSVAGRTGAVVLSSSDVTGLGTAAGLDAGTAAGNVVQLDGTARIPASTLPANAVTTSTALSGDVTGTVSTVSVDKIKGTPVNATAPVAGQAMVFNGTEWVPTYGVPMFTRVTADQATTSTTAISATNMSFPVIAGNVYKYKFLVLYTSTSSNNGLRLGLTYPAVSTASAVANIAAATDSTGAYYQGVINSSGDVVAATSTAASNLIEISTVEGILVPTANGTVQLKFGSELSSQTVTIKAGSLVEYTIVP